MEMYEHNIISKLIETHQRDLQISLQISVVFSFYGKHQVLLVLCNARSHHPVSVTRYLLLSYSLLYQLLPLYLYASHSINNLSIWIRVQQELNPVRSELFHDIGKKIIKRTKNIILH